MDWSRVFDVLCGKGFHDLYEIPERFLARWVRQNSHQKFRLGSFDYLDI
jgi:hypothetical protein